MGDSYTRRELLQKAALVTTSAVLAEGVGGDSLKGSQTPLPRRKLGRTGVEISTIGLGLAPLGIAHYSPEEFHSVVQAALDEGVNYFDMQPDYGEAERYLAPLARGCRERLFLVTKTCERSKAAVLQSLRESLGRLGVERLDAVLLNNIGDYDMNQVFGKNGALAGLKEARRQGQVRFFGVSGHYRPDNFVQILESGEFDIVMAPFNFVDRFIYRFEQEVLPVAAKYGVAAVAMKTLGGAVGLKYDTREQVSMLSGDQHELAIRYVLGLPGVCSAVIGCKSAAEMRLAARSGRRYRPLSNSESASAQSHGKELAAKWGRRYPEG